MELESADLVGAAWLARRFGVGCVAPMAVVSRIGGRRATRIEGDATLETHVERMRPVPSLRGHLVFHLKHEVPHLELLARVAKSDCLGREPGTFNCQAMDWFLERARALGVQHAPPQPILLGRHLIALGVKPGPRMGEILKAVYEQQLDGSVTTVDEGLAAARALLGT